MALFYPHLQTSNSRAVHLTGRRGKVEETLGCTGTLWSELINFVGLSLKNEYMILIRSYMINTCICLFYDNAKQMFLLPTTCQLMYKWNHAVLLDLFPWVDEDRAQFSTKAFGPSPIEGTTVCKDPGWTVVDVVDVVGREEALSWGKWIVRHWRLGSCPRFGIKFNQQLQTVKWSSIAGNVR